MSISMLNSAIGWIIGLGIFIVILAVILAVLPVKYWFRCLVSGTYLSMMKLFGMKLRGINLNIIIDSYINAKKAGLDLNINDLENHILAGGNVNKVVMALISAHSAKIDLTTEQAKAIDLAGRDVLQAVKESVTPKIIQTPKISTIAKDGIELIITAKVTVKTNLQRLVGGAGEETIISRVGEGIVTTVGSTETHAQVLENPDEISRTVLLKGLSSGTAYEILSVDIADIDVGRNVGADLLKMQAQADKEIAQAKAEERKSMALAEEQEMKAKTQEKRARVVEAEAEVPKAMAEAFKEGKLGVYDYYKMQNILADTSMRKSFSQDKDGDDQE
ncbi:MAG: flotillin-like protein FloA [Christensenellales bacterium]